MISEREQQLVDIGWQAALMMSEHRGLQALSIEKKAEWFARQLSLCGFPNRPIGSLYHYLTDEPGHEYKAEP